MPPPHPGEGHGPGEHHHGGPPPGPDFRFLSSEMRYDGKVIKGAPFSAQALIKSTQSLADGTVLTHESTGFIARDKEGRTRREYSLEALGPFSSKGEEVKFIVINDPVAGVQFHLDPNRKQSRKMGDRGSHPPPPPPQYPEGFEEKTESLGKQTISGVEAEGKRNTVTIPIGAIGNNKALQIVSEQWFSPSLQIVVQSKHKDPRMGETVFQLNNLTLKEPAPELFAVPSDYTTRESEGPQGPREKGRPRPRDE